MEYYTFEDKIYTAGLLDGEGYIGIATRKPNAKTREVLSPYWLRVTITNTNKELIVWLKDTFRGHITDISRSPSQGRRRPCYSWSITGKWAMIFLELVYPYLRVKKEQVELGIEFQKNRANLRYILPQDRLDEVAWRESYKQKISRLNQAEAQDLGIQY